MAGQSAERQETEFVEAINNAVEQNLEQPITVKSKDATVTDVIGAEKFQGRSVAGTEPYTDVVLNTVRGPVNLSMKGPSAPSLAGGGLAGIELVLPGIGRQFMQAALQHHLRSGLQPGDEVPDLYAKLNDNDKLKLVVGNKKNGGPIDYMYIGPMSVKSSFKNGVVTVNGSLIDAVKYAKEHDLFFRLRARRHDQRFDPEAKDRKGIPTVYSRSPSKGDAKGRIVITDKVPRVREVITF